MPKSTLFLLKNRKNRRETPMPPAAGGYAPRQFNNYSLSRYKIFKLQRSIKYQGVKLWNID